MAGKVATVRLFAVNAVELITFLPFTVLLHHFHLIGRAPLWLFCCLLLGAGLCQQPGVQRWLAGGDLGRRLSVRMALHVGMVAAIAYVSGWGPLLGVAFVLVASMHIGISGSGVWRPVMGWSLAASAAGQLAIAAGWVDCYFLPSPYMHVIGGGGALIAAFAVRTVGLAAEHREQAEERFRTLVQDSYDVVVVCAEDGRLTYVSPAAERVSGIRPDEMTGTGFTAWLHPDDVTPAEQMLAAATAEPGGHRTAEMRMRCPDGSWYWVEVTARNLLHNPVVAGLVVNYHDITDRRADRERLAHDASHDALTGLLNRAAFLHVLTEAVAGTGSTAVLFVDLDGLKQVNDTLGHDIGDALIMAAGMVLRRCVLGSDMVGRLGGDEFGVVLSAIASAQDATSVAKRILAEMEQPLDVAGRRVDLRASIGVAVAVRDDGGRAAVSGADLLHQADVAMYAAKRRRTHSYELYADGMLQISPATQ